MVAIQRQDRVTTASICNAHRSLISHESIIRARDREREGERGREREGERERERERRERERERERERLKESWERWEGWVKATARRIQSHPERT